MDILTSEDFDDVQARFIEEALLSRGWELFERRLDAIAADKVRELRRDLDGPATSKVRGYLEALERVKALRAQMLEEARG